jgi:hypothetical protein
VVKTTRDRLWSTDFHFTTTRIPYQLVKETCIHFVLN